MCEPRLSMAAWGSPVSILLGTAEHRGNRLGTHRNSTSRLEEGAGERPVLRVAHRAGWMAP
jgi:hypothetical protein